MLKYEHSDILNKVLLLNIMKEYNILKSLKISNRKGSFIVSSTKQNKKMFMKVKLKDFLSRNEIEIYKKIKKNPHRNVNKIYNIYLSNIFIIIISEYIEGYDMSKLEYNKNCDNNLDNIFLESLNGISHLHSLDIIHGDIKPENIMIDTNNIPIIIDFDLSRLTSEIKINKSCGSIGFIPPEIHHGMIDKKSDIWALAMTFYYYIFKDKINDDIQNTETNEYFDISFLNMNLLNKYMGKHYKTINNIKNMLNNDYMLRPEINNIISCY